MTALTIDYESQVEWVKGYLVNEHAASVKKTAWAVGWVLAAQSLTPADMARALPMEESGSGRSRLRRIQRWRQGSISPQVRGQLVKTALALAGAGDPIVVALDTTRTGRWELFVAGIVFEHRVLPVAWAVIPYPWPRGSFRQTVLRLIEALRDAFPKGVQWMLVADQGFSSTPLFAALSGIGFTIRLRLSDWVRVDGVYAQVKHHLEQGRLREGVWHSAIIGRGSKQCPATWGAIAVSSRISEPPKHKRNPGTDKERQARARAKAKHDKDRRPRPPSEVARKYSQTWVLFTTTQSARCTSVLQPAHGH
jgi:hypothetical protein